VNNKDRITAGLIGTRGIGGSNIKVTGDGIMDTIANVRRLVERIITTGGIAGVLAIIITITLCGRYISHGPEEIPQIFTNALTTIIGFYFGVSVKGETPSSN
jgi:hypothetical protein